MTDMIELNDDQIEATVGGIVEGPNGEGCTDPRRETAKDAYLQSSF